MFDKNDWLPASKKDFLKVKKLAALDSAGIKPLLRPLLYWISDMNWPIAPSIVQILKKHPQDLMPLIVLALDDVGTDDDLKYNIIMFLIPELPLTYQKELEMHIKRIRDTPSNAEAKGSQEAANWFFEEATRRKRSAK